MNAKQIWQTTMERLQGKVPPAVFTTWFQGTSALSFQDGIFVVRVPTTFAKAHLEGRFLDVIRSILSEISGGPVEVQIVVAKEIPAEQGSDLAGKQSHPASKRPYRLPKNRLTSLYREEPTSFIDKLDRLSEESMSGPTPQTVLPIAMTSTPPGVPVVHRDSEHPQQPEAQNHHKQAQFPSFPRNGDSLLNPRYTFSTFIVGKCNQLAHAASLAVAEDPGHIYNPLFFYGGVGLGKTHLLHAVGHVGESAGLNVLYVTSEKFTNEIINAIRYQKTEEFRSKYRQIDILLVDDIQFIAGKESTEEEFFHTFNTLYDANKQIIVTSDRPPKAIHSLQDRLRSRFEWGLLADISLPEYEHRLAILRSKADSLRFAVPASVIEYIARPECSSVRELEGSLNRVVAYATLHDAPLSIGLTVQALAHVYKESKPLLSLTVVEVLEGVCRYYNLEPDLLKGKQRNKEIVWPRQVAMYVMREETNASLLQIGTELGGRDHTTIIHGWEKVHDAISNNERVRREIAALLEMLQKK